MRFAFIAKNADMLPVERLCQIMDVSPRGYRAYRNRPLSQSQRKDMVLLAHIREQFTLSLGSYGRPRMTEELKELGLPVGHRRVGRLMRDNGIAVRRNRTFKGKEDQETIRGIVSLTSGPQPQLQHRTELAEPGLLGSPPEPEMGG